MAGLPQRHRAVAPFWLAVVFAFSLPIEPMVQRVFGFIFQHWSAAMACQALSLMASEVTCDGIRIVRGELDLLVDVPCSGASLLVSQ